MTSSRNDGTDVAVSQLFDRMDFLCIRGKCTKKTHTNTNTGLQQTKRCKNYVHLFVYQCS
jgi:hypothetical protein